MDLDLAGPLNRVLLERHTRAYQTVSARNLKLSDTRAPTCFGTTTSNSTNTEADDRFLPSSPHMIEFPLFCNITCNITIPRF